MDEQEKALQGAEPAQHILFEEKIYDVQKKERWALGLMALLCLLFVDTLLWYGPGLGAAVTVVGWYVALLAYVGTSGLRRAENRVLLAVNLLLALTLALTSNQWFRVWNTLALMALLPIHALALSGVAKLPWWRPAMLLERVALLGKGLFCNLPAAFYTAESVVKRKNGKGSGAKIILGCAVAILLVVGLIALLCAADTLFAYEFRKFTDLFRRINIGEFLLKLLIAVAMLPFLFGFLYAQRHQQTVRVPAPAHNAMDATAAMIVLGAMAGLYAVYLGIQSAGLFGGQSYLEARGLNYAEWARSGFFQLVFVTILNLTLLMGSLHLCRTEGKALRLLATLLTLESFVLLGSAAWRMTLYILDDGLTFKRIMTYWGMAVMAVFWAAAAIKIWRPKFSFCRVAFLTAVLGWVLISYTPIDYIVARNQTARYAAGENPGASANYLAYDLSFDTLNPLEQIGVDPELVAQRRAAAKEQCGRWQTWNLSAWLAQDAVENN